jgi:bifunctional non-homologous end joining protein LigD
VARTTSPHRDLADYDAKRDFGRTPEPAGAPPRPAAAPGGIFVVQRHRARALHYDLRLEVDGVLASWAVPKGPTLDPRTRTLAVQVEDHPMEYADFEGVIPAGEYGGGDVIVWDRGTWSPARTDDPAAAIAAGELHFDLAGEKLAGRFVLVRTGADGRGRNQWLLLHKADDAAVPGWRPEDHPRSVKSGRTNDEVRDAPEALWRSDLPAAEAEVPVEQAAGSDRQPSAGPGRRPRRGRPPAGGPSAAELARLDALGADGRWQVGGHRVALSGLGDVVTRPAGEEPLTVRDLVRYHATVAPLMLPYLVDRPVAVRRFAEGLARPSADAGDLVARAPRWVRRWRDPGDGPEADAQLVVDGVAALAWVVGERGFELRPSTAPAEAPASPTWVVIGIEPGAATAPVDLALVGRLFGTALRHLGLAGGVRADGTRGLEVWVPAGAGATLADTDAWASDLVRSISASVPDLVGADRSARARGERVRLAVRARRGRPPVVPYGVVARRDAPIAVPLQWEELDDADAWTPDWSLRSVVERLGRAADPWADLVGAEQELPPL